MLTMDEGRKFMVWQSFIVLLGAFFQNRFETILLLQLTIIGVISCKLLIGIWAFCI